PSRWTRPRPTRPSRSASAPRRESFAFSAMASSVRAPCSMCVKTECTEAVPTRALAAPPVMNCMTLSGVTGDMSLLLSGARLRPAPELLAVAILEHEHDLVRTEAQGSIAGDRASPELARAAGGRARRADAHLRAA